MAEVQTLTAALNLAGLALTALDWAQRVKNAPTEADELCQRTKTIHALTENAAVVIESRNHAAGTAFKSPIEAPILEAIRNSLQECERRLTSINTKLRPLEDAGFIERLKFTCSAVSIKNQAEILDKKIAQLMCQFGLLGMVELQNLLKGIAQRVPVLGQTSGAIEPMLSDNGCSARNEASESSDVVDEGNDFTRKGSDGCTALHHAARSLNFDALQSLLVRASGLPQAKRLKFMDEVDRRGQTALMIVSGHADNVISTYLARALIAENCDLHITDSVPRSALSHAVERPKTAETARFVILLVLSGAKVKKMTPPYQDHYKTLKTEHPDLFARFASQTGGRRATTTEETQTAVGLFPGSEVVELKDSVLELERRQTEPSENEASSRRGGMKAFLRRFSLDSQ